MTRVLFVGQDPKTVDFTDPALQPGLNAEKIQAGIDLGNQDRGARLDRGPLHDLARRRRDSHARETARQRNL